MAGQTAGPTTGASASSPQNAAAESDDARTYSSSRADSVAPTALTVGSAATAPQTLSEEDDLIISTLVQIERLLVGLRDTAPLPPTIVGISVFDICSRPALLHHRTEVHILYCFFVVFQKEEVLGWHGLLTWPLCFVPWAVFVIQTHDFERASCFRLLSWAISRIDWSWRAVSARHFTWKSTK